MNQPATQLRQQVKESKSHLQVVESVPVKVNDTQYQGPQNKHELDAMLETVQAQPATQSIAAAKSLFTASHKKTRIRKIYNSFDRKQRGMCCIAGGLKADVCDKSFDELDSSERQAVRHGIAYLDEITTRFKNNVGSPSQFKSKDFH
ncbi:hypothetical protein [Vibrio scophthalmi]|uniref:Uncharacterized protein n=1 Tax=Vibrio scophthalmi TaxID=45658 RepID=A0A1C7F8Q1_9VIBR|nr:hypothetical protein [Vibrio scophthalmi]ANU36261.1 hypothetical protein VSVS05_01134 [Vibrio scophthalmi]